MRDFCLYIIGIYFFNLIFFPVVFSKQTLTHMPRKSIFVHFVNDLVSEMWVSKVTTKDIFFFFCTYLLQNCWLEEKYAFINHARYHRYALYILQLSEVFLFTVRYHSFTGFVNEDICIFYRIYFCLRMISNMLMHENGNRAWQNL